MFADVFVRYTTVISSTILATLAVMLFVLRLPKKEEFGKLRIAKICQALALSTIVVINVFKLTVTFTTSDPDRDFVLGVVMNCAITLLAFTTIYIFIAPHSVSRPWLTRQIAYIVGVAVIGIIADGFIPDPDIADAIYIIMLAVNVLQVCYYSYMFHNRLPHYIAYMRQHGVTIETRLVWIRFNLPRRTHLRHCGRAFQRVSAHQARGGGVADCRWNSANLLHPLQHLPHRAHLLLQCAQFSHRDAHL